MFLVVGYSFIIISTSELSQNISGLWKLGFGSINGSNLLKVNTSLIGGVLLANLPQLFVTYFYLSFNSFYTTMLVAREWSSYTKHRKGLRVTRPVGMQRSTYWLSVPFRFGVPMILVSGALHWLTSQSLFAVRITILDADDRSRITEHISTCGYSPIALILITILGTIIAIGGFAVSRFTYPTGIPLASSCSAAISAACHPSQYEPDASHRPVQWGVTSHDIGILDWRGNEIGHCSFSSLPVDRLIPGKRYI